MINPGDFLLETNDQLDMEVPIRCITVGREPFEHVDDLPDIGDITNASELLDNAIKIRDFIKHGNYALLNWVKPSVDNLWKVSLDQFDCILYPPPEWYGLKKEQLKLWLNKLIEWAESKVVPVLEFENGQKVEEKDVTAEFREGGKPTGTILTSTYLIESDDWYFKYPKQFTEAMSAQRLTRWIKVGRPFAYLYTELAAMNREDAMKPDA